MSFDPKDPSSASGLPNKVKNGLKASINHAGPSASKSGGSSSQLSTGISSGDRRAPQRPTIESLIKPSNNGRPSSMVIALSPPPCSTVSSTTLKPFNRRLQLPHERPHRNLTTAPLFGITATVGVTLPQSDFKIVGFIRFLRRRSQQLVPPFGLLLK
jgi:hypothetical protein